MAWTTLDQPIRAFNFAHGQLASEGKYHPTQKPITLMEWCIRFLPESCRTIVDPFAGSGTTLVAAKNEGRRAVGIEADERYCEVAAKRLTQDTLFGGVA
jgi:site-specific DNA-methyltransferase (adenine-specific)